MKNAPPVMKGPSPTRTRSAAPPAPGAASAAQMLTPTANSPFANLVMCRLLFLIRHPEVRARRQVHTARTNFEYVRASKDDGHSAAIALRGAPFGANLRVTDHEMTLSHDDK